MKEKNTLQGQGSNRRRLKHSKAFVLRWHPNQSIEFKLETEVKVWALNPPPVHHMYLIPLHCLKSYLQPLLLFPASSFFFVPSRNITINIQKDDIFPILNKILTAYSITVSGPILFHFRAKVLERANITSVYILPLVPSQIHFNQSSPFPLL